ncbi:S-layer homology domain-containing protein [Paenibacillus sp. UNC451MF]|uniref:S-layer homology domain-containing protein n=1 Tax=Paenibacillus sp. UNC451MF TaxID=1449063 RepID=UPI00048FA24F|nr:S-layer homology domain-containing protein [Paenibacillus sp. UNC451MF]
MQGKKPFLILMILSLVLGMLPISSAWAGSSSSGPSTITDPRSLAYHDGYIYVAQRDADKISRISVATGQVSDVLVMSKYANPMSVAFNSQGDLFYTNDNYTSIVYKIPASSLTDLPLNSAQITSNSQIFYTGTTLHYPYGLAFDADDNLYMTDYTTKGIYKLGQGQVLEPIFLSTTQPLYGINFSPNGDLYFFDEWGKIYKIAQADLTGKIFIDPSKRQLIETVPGGFGIVFLPDGTHYISTSNVHKHTFVNEATAAAKALIPSTLTVTEGTYSNLLTYLNGLPGMADTGVTLTLASSNSSIANNGAITYSNTDVNGNVTVKINKVGDTQDTKTIAVTVASIAPVPDVVNTNYSATPTSITLNWDNPLINMKGIRIKDANDAVTSSVTTNTYTFTGLTPNTAYSYKVIVIDNRNMESAGVTIHAATLEAPSTTLTGLSVNQSSVNLEEGGSAPAVVTATYSDHTSAVVTSLLAWSSDNSQVASVSNTGVITAHSAGSATITGELSRYTVTISVTVSPAPISVDVVSLSVNPVSIIINLGNTKQLEVTATYSDKTTADVAALSEYKTANENVVTVSPAGLITATGIGTSNVTVTFQNQTKVVEVTVYRPSSSHSSSSSSAAATQPSTDTKQPVETDKPSDKSTEQSAPNVFKNEAVQNDSHVVNNIKSRIEEAQKNNAMIPFSDTKQHWAEKTINTFIKLKVIDGYENGQFKPDSEITRAEFATIIDKVFQIVDTNKQSVELNDISSHWAKEVIDKLAKAGILNGYGQEFRPDQTITRAEMVAIISRIVNMNAVQGNNTVSEFSDISQSFAAKQIQESAKAGIIAGKGGNKFDPEAPSTRAEALTMILNTLNLSPQIKNLLDSIK